MEESTSAVVAEKCTKDVTSTPSQLATVLFKAATCEVEGPAAARRLKYTATRTVSAADGEDDCQGVGTNEGSRVGKPVDTFTEDQILKAREQCGKFSSFRCLERGGMNVQGSDSTIMRMEAENTVRFARGIPEGKSVGGTVGGADGGGCEGKGEGAVEGGADVGGGGPSPHSQDAFAQPM